MIILRPVCFIAVCSIAQASLHNCVANDLFLVQNNKPASRIVLPPKPTKLETLAGGELWAYMKKATGAELDIVADTDAGELADAEV